MMKLGVIYDDTTQLFLEELIEDWLKHFETSVYEFTPVTLPFASGRINPFLHQRSLKKFINQNDIVFFEWVGENLALASQLPHQAKIITRLHSWELFHYAQWVNWSSVDRIILLSQAMRKRFAEMYPGHEERIVILPAGKSLTRFVPNHHSFNGNLAMLGNLISIKRIYEMVLTLSELHRQGHHFTLHLAGKPGEHFNNKRYYASFLGLIEKLGLSEYVVLHGWVDPADWLPNMDIYISNSYWEGQQNTLVEAMASGCYCLSHFWDGSEEILPEECLYSTEASLVKKIIQYVEMPESEKWMWQSRMRSIVSEKFDLALSIEQYRALIESVFHQ